MNSGSIAPNLIVSRWAQGQPTNLDKLRGRIVVVEVFQVNCPGCFLYGLPEVIEIHSKYGSNVTVLGLATAFEDFDKNTDENLDKLLTRGEVIGETLHGLQSHGWVNGNILRYKIPFPVAMDTLKKPAQENFQNQVEFIIDRDISNFERLSYGEQTRIRESIHKYLTDREWMPQTFELYNMSGTPTTLIIDQNGILRHKIFGQYGKIEKMVKQLL